MTKTERIIHIIYTYMYFMSAQMRTLYLFVCDYNIIVLTWSLLGMFCSSSRLSHCFLPNEPFGQQRNLLGQSGALPRWPFSPSLIIRFPLVFTWIGLAALGFSLANQRLSSSIDEDKLNKPWRPVPSGRISPAATGTLRWFVCSVGFVFSLCVGGCNEFVVQMIASFSYNDLGASQGLWIIRDIHNAIGLVSWLVGCISIAGGTEIQYTSCKVLSAGVLFLVVATTIAIQDFRDVDGDRAAGRRTLPILVGDDIARLITSGLILAWTYGVGINHGKVTISVVTLATVGTGLAAWLVMKRTRMADKVALQGWYVWFAALSVVVFG